MPEFQADNAGASEVQQKQASAYLWKQSSTGVATSGVIAGLAVTQSATPDGNVLIAVGSAINQANLGQGCDQLVNPGVKTHDVLTANPMGALSRTDIIAFDSLTSLLITILGTPNASPVDPTIPATSTPLARLRHAASAVDIPAAKIDDLRTFTYQGGSDTGWITLPLLTGWSVYAGLTPAYRRLNGMVNFQGRATSTGAGNLGTMPAGFRPGPLIERHFWAHNSAGVSSGGWIASTGGIFQNPGSAAVTGWMLDEITPYPADL